MSNITPDQVFTALHAWRCIDLSVTIERGIPRWQAHPHLTIDPGITHEQDGYYCQSISMSEHTGTHVDAPAHVHADLMAQSIDQLSPEVFIGRAVVADLSPLALKEGEHATLAEVQQALERHHLQPQAGDIVFFNFGWMRHWKSGREGKFYASNQPGLSREVADWVLHSEFKAIGSDTIAVGAAMVAGSNQYCPFHYEVLRKVPMFECLANLEKIDRPFLFLGAPLKIRAGSGAPVRALAFLPN